MATLPIVTLLIGAVAVWLARRQHERVQWSIALVAGLVTWGVVLGVSGAMPATTRLSVWRPDDLFASRLELVLDPIGWRFTYGTATLVLAILLTDAARPRESVTASRTSLLVLAGLGAVAMLSGNLLTVATTWALMDILVFASLLGPAARQGSADRLVGQLAVSGVGVLLVVGAALASWAAQGRNLLLSGLSSPLALGLLVIAVFFRLGVLIPGFDLNHGNSGDRGWGTLQGLMPPAAALCVLGRVLGSNAPLQILPWLRVSGFLGLAVGGTRWAIEPNAPKSRRYFVLGVAGLGLLVGGTSEGTASAVIGASGLLLLLVGAVVSLVEIHTPSHRLWPVSGALILAGLPWTPGGLIAETLGTQALSGGAWWVVLVGALGIAALSLGVVRTGMAEVTPWPTGESLVKLVYGSGLALPLFVAIGLGLWAPGSKGIVGAAVFATALALGAGLQFGIQRVPRKVSDWWVRWVSSVDFTPVYKMLLRTSGGALQFARAVGEVLEGEGAMLWTYVILLLVLLAVR